MSITAIKKEDYGDERLEGCERAAFSEVALSV